MMTEELKELDEMEAFEIIEIESLETPSTAGNTILVAGIYVGVIYGICAC